MEIIAKAIVLKEELEAKIKDGVNKIEVQLMKDFFLEENTVDDYFNETIRSNVLIYNVHTPLISGEDCNLEYFTNPIQKNMFLKCCELSQRYAEYYKRDINIIVHNSFSLDTYKQIPCLLNSLVELFEEIIIKYPNVIITFENVVPYAFLANGIGSRSGYTNENVIIAKYFNEICSKKIFKTTLDICHILTSLKNLSIFKNEPKFKVYNLDMEYFFKENKDTINNIHLCNLTNLGLGHLEHGSPFCIENKEDMKLLEEIITLYYKYNYDALVTLEVIEENYENCINFRKTKEALEFILKKLNK